MRSIVIYYSFEGNTKLMAKEIAGAINADLAEIKPEKEIDSKGFMKYIWGGSQVMMKKRPKILPMDISIDDYDVIYIGTPIWAWTYAPPVGTFLDNYKISGKKIALFSCNEGQNGKTFSHFKEKLKNNKFLGEIDFFAPLKSNRDQSISKVKDWAIEMFTKAKSEV